MSKKWTNKVSGTEDHKDMEINAQEVNQEPESQNSEQADLITKLEHQLKTIAADYDNYRKRVIKDLEDARQYSTTKFAKDLVEVLENLYRAQESMDSHEIEQNQTLKQIFEGVELVKKSLIDAFTKNGIERIHPLNQPFDHDLHQAISEGEFNGIAQGSVGQVIQAGYTMNGRLLRPALVIVAK